MEFAMTRFFRSTPATYEAIRSQLDSAWGYPNDATQTETAIPPAGELAKDSEGRVYLSISAAYCDYILPSQMLPELIATGAVEEIDESAYLAILPPSAMASA